MGKGAIFLGNVFEMVIPTLLCFGLVYAAVHGLSVPKGRGVRVIGLWALTFVLAGVSNAIFYVPINRSEYHSMIFMGIALFYSAWVILLFRPKSDVSHRAEPPAKQDSNRK